MDASFRLKVASPCPMSWDEMDGDERIRFCGQCERNVFNISSMTRAEAEKLITQTEDRVCGRFWVREDGSVLTADCPVGWRARMRRRAAWAGGMLAAATGLLLTGLVGLRAGERDVPGFLVIKRVATWLGWNAPAPPPPRLLVGKIRLPTPPTPPTSAIADPEAACEEGGS